MFGKIIWLTISSFIFLEPLLQVKFLQNVSILLVSNLLGKVVISLLNILIYTRFCLFYITILFIYEFSRLIFLIKLTRFVSISIFKEAMFGLVILHIIYLFPISLIFIIFFYFKPSIFLMFIHLFFLHIKLDA